MKKLFSLISILYLQFTMYGQPSQPQPITIATNCSGITLEDATDYTYFADLEGKFDPFIGTWVYSNGSDIVTFQLSKITQRYFADDKIFMDFMVGNYSYSNDGGNTLVVNTILPTVDTDPNNNPMYTSCAEDNKMVFYFDDVVLNKKLCYATFELINGSTTQMHVKIENPQEVGGSLDGTPPYNFNFTLPTQMIVTKQ